MSVKKYTVAIEEMVTQEFEVEAEDFGQAIELAIEKYKKGEFVLEPGEVDFTQIAIVEPPNEVTEWMEF